MLEIIKRIMRKKGRRKPDIKIILLAIIAVVCAAAYHEKIAGPQEWNAARDRLSRKYVGLLDSYGKWHVLQQRTLKDKIIRTVERDFRFGTTPGTGTPPVEGETKTYKENSIDVTLADLNEENFRKTDAPLRIRNPRPNEKPVLPYPPRYTARPSPVSAVPVYCGSRTDPRICLTFDSGDAGGGIYYHHRVLDTLVRDGTPATFFLTGKFIETYPGISKRIARTRLFELGNHTHTHPDLTLQSDKRIQDELGTAQAVMVKIAGKRGSLFRAPYGKLDGRVAAAGARLGLRAIQWDVSVADYSNTLSASNIARSVLAQVRNGSIILLHINGKSAGTYDALEDIISGLRKKGYRFVTVSELIKSMR